MTVYTRTGDAGTIALSIGQRVSRTHPRVEAYGTLDKLNTALSLYICATKNPQYRQLLENIQLQPFWLGAELVSKNEEPTPEQRYINSGEIAALEAAIDIAMGRVPPLHSSILPDRSEAASRLHFARMLAYHIERQLVELFTEISAKHVLMRYISRLPGCLYAPARAEDHDAHRNDVIQKMAECYLTAVQAPTIKEPTISLSFWKFHQLTRATMTRAEELRVPIVINIVDADGAQMVTWRMPDALLMSSELILKKARAAMAMRAATRELTSTAQPGATLCGLESHMQGKVVTFGDGYTLWREGLLLGGLGISGESVEQSIDITETAIVTIDVRTHQ